MSFSKNIRISSLDREILRLDQTNSNFSIDVPSFSREFASITGYQIVSAEFPNVFYNVPLGQDIFKYNVSSTDLEYKVPEGQYAISELITELTTNIPELTSIVIDSKTSRATLTFTGAAFINSGPDNPIAKLLGFGSFVETFPPPPVIPGTIIEAPSTINMNGASMLYISSQRLANPISTFDRTGDTAIISAIPINTAFGDTVFYRANSSNSTLISFRNPRSVSSIDIRLVDEIGNTLDLQKNHITMTIKIYFEL